MMKGIQLLPLVLGLTCAFSGSLRTPRKVSKLDVNRRSRFVRTTYWSTQFSLSESDRNGIQPTNNNDNTTRTDPLAETRTETDVLDSVPSYRTLLVFLSTTLLIWLSEPLLSLVDTTIVGLTQGTTATIQLASLGPATTLMDSLFYSTYFLSIATTNKIAKERAENDLPALQRTTSHVLTVATILGVLCTVFCFGLGRPLLTSMAGASATPELVHYALSYIRIRSLAAIATVSNITMQSFCLANLDTVTPARAVAAASLVNVVGDIALRSHGVAGAATATALASLVSAGILFRAVRRQLRVWRKQDPEHALPLFQIPDRAAAVGLLRLSGPIFFVIVSKILCYGAMNLRCTSFGITEIATHGIMMRIWFLIGCFGDALSQAAQSFLPATLYPTFSPQAFARLFRRLGTIAGVGGLINSQVSMQVLQRLGGLLTRDSAIIRLMSRNTGYFGVSMFLHAFIMLLEGTVIASRNFSTLFFTYGATLGLHFGILKFFSGSFTKVWRTFFWFQSIRLGLYAGRVYWRQRRSDVVTKEKTV